MQQLQPLGDRACTEYGDPSGVAARSVQARYQALRNRIPIAGEHDMNRLSGRFGYLRWRFAPGRGNYVDLSAH